MWLLIIMGLFLPATVGLAVPVLPAINTNNVVVVTHYGAKGDNQTDNATAIQSAISAAASGGTTNGLAGGTVEIPAGIYLCGPIRLTNCVNLQIDGGAILRMLPFGQYPVTWNITGGVTNSFKKKTDFITGNLLHDLEISGSGTIDGQGQPWWPWATGDREVSPRPIMIRLSRCNRLLIQDVTLLNGPEFHIIVEPCTNVTVQGITIQAPSSERSQADPPSHNTDGCDASGAHILVQNCNISTGDDDITFGGGTSDVLISNINVGAGHGISIGSRTYPGVSKVVVRDCTFNGTMLGVDIRSDEDRGGIIQDIAYYNLKMTNILICPIEITGYYKSFGAFAHHFTPSSAANTRSSVGKKTPIFRNITYSNITAYASGQSFPVGYIWARTEMPATNIVFNKVKIVGNARSESFWLYNVSGVQFIDSSIDFASVSPYGKHTFALFNAQTTISNSVPEKTTFTFSGLTTNISGHPYANSLALCNARAALQNTNTFDSGLYTLSGSTLSVTNDLSLASDSVINFVLGTNAATMMVAGNLSMSGQINVIAGVGFTNGNYTIFTYGRSLTWKAPRLGGTPPNFSCSFNTETSGQVKLVVTSPKNSRAYL